MFEQKHEKYLVCKQINTVVKSFVYRLLFLVEERKQK